MSATVTILAAVACGGDPRPEEGEGAIEGVIFDRYSGLALADATVRVGRSEVQSDIRGLFRLPTVGKGSRILSVSRDGFSDHIETVAVVEGETTAIVVRLAPVEAAGRLPGSEPRSPRTGRSVPDARYPRPGPAERAAASPEPEVADPGGASDRRIGGGSTRSEPTSPGVRVEFETLEQHCFSPAPTYLCMSSAAGDYIGQGRDLFLTLEGARFALSSGSGAAVSVRVEGDHSWRLEFAPPNGEKLVPGLYDGAARYPMHRGRRPGLSVTGAGRGCNRLEGRFLVHAIAYSNEGAVEAFAADFEQHCDGGADPLVGRIFVNVEVAPESRRSERRTL